MLKQLWMHKRDGVISLAVVMSLLLIVFVVALTPVLNQVATYRAELARDARILQQLRAVDSARDNLETVFTEYQDKNLQALVYSQERADTVTLDIQRRVSTELVAASAPVKSVSPLRERIQNEYSVVGVQVEFAASMPSLMQVLTRLEQDKPLLVIDSMVLSPVRVRRAGEKTLPEQAVDVKMTVVAFLKPGQGTEGVQ